jgi:hypothetical protein
VQEEVLALYDAAAPGLRRYVRSCVCANQVAQAQREIASDWVAAYKQYFKTDVPLQAHVGAPLADEDELEFAPMALNIR